MAATDIFARQELNFGGAFPADTGLIVPVPGTGLDGILMTQAQCQYQQQISKIYELGNVKTPLSFYAVNGRAQGTLTTGSVIGPRLGMATFYSKFGNICNMGTNQVDFKANQANCGADAVFDPETDEEVNGTIDVTAKACVLNSFGFNVSSNDMVINSSSGIMFQTLEYNES